MPAAISVTIKARAVSSHKNNPVPRSAWSSPCKSFEDENTTGLLALTVWIRWPTPCCRAASTRSAEASGTCHSASERPALEPMFFSRASSHPTCLWPLQSSNRQWAPTGPEPPPGSLPPGPYSLVLPSMGPKKKKKHRQNWVPPPPLDSSIIVDPNAFVSGADIVITGGAHQRIRGLKGYISTSFLLQRWTALRST